MTSSFHKLPISVNYDFGYESLTTGIFYSSDYILLVLLISLVIFSGITKIGHLWRTRLFLLSSLGMLGFLTLKSLTIINLNNLTYLTMADNAFLVDLTKILALILLGYFILMQAEEKTQALNFEYPTIVLIAFFGILLTLENTESLIIFLGLEIQAFSYYTMVSLNQKEVSSAEGALKYFLIGAMASGLFILGVGLLYGNFGKTNFTEIIDFMPAKEYFVILGGLLIIISLLFKIGAVPFHLWLPDAYTGAPFYVLLFLLTLPKIGLFYLLFTLNNIFEQNMLVLLALILSALVGSIQAYAQTKIKRFLAYTVIYNNAFFLAIMFLAGNGAFYTLFESLILYLIVTLGTALCFFALKRGESDIHFWNLRDLISLKKSHGILALILILGFFSAAGIPPFLGFFQKYLILWVLAEKFQIFLLVILIFSSILPAFYYIRIPKITYFVSESKYILIRNLDKTLSALLALTAILGLGIFY